MVLVIVPPLIFAETLTVRADVHWRYFAHILESEAVLSFGWHRDLIWLGFNDLDLISFHVIWFVILHNDLNLFVKWFVISDCNLICDLPITDNRHVGWTLRHTYIFKVCHTGMSQWNCSTSGVGMLNEVRIFELWFWNSNSNCIHSVFESQIEICLFSLSKDRQCYILLFLWQCCTNTERYKTCNE